ncbi:MAG TPA: VWA domain-containing protein [Thermoanaerobaculia bacterium]|nr:VWA domain-containing protein [Thermoanaerobaculia bacterium]
MRSRLASIFILLAAAGSWPAAAQDLNLNGIQDRFDLPGTQARTMPIQDFQLATVLPPASACSGCHNTMDHRGPLRPWAGSMMGNAARDPVFWAQLDVAETDEAEIPSLAGGRDLCLRCHIAKGWTEGRSSGPDLATALRGMAMQPDDLFGVQCEVCHRLVDRNNGADPVDAQVLAGLASNPDPELRIPPSFGNGMYVLDRHDVRRGPFSSAQIAWPGLTTPTTQFIPPAAYPPDGSLFHPIKHSPFHRHGNLCGTCHDVSNPAWTPAEPKGNTQANFPIERTWTEWTHSQYSTMGENGNCQSCHMNAAFSGLAGGGASTASNLNPVPHTNDLHVHDLTGGNVAIPIVIRTMIDKYQATKLNDPGAAPVIGATEAARDAFLDTYYAKVVDALYPAGTFADAAGDFPPFYDPANYDSASNRAKATLGRAAQLAFNHTPGGDLELRIYNMTGHKLPTGYPEGRRMWLNVKFSGIDSGTAAETLLGESGRYDQTTGTLFHDFDLENDVGSKPYDGITYTNAAGGFTGFGRRTQVYEARLHHAPSGVEFHFIRNNEVRSDNRIPPLGWNKAQYIANNAGQTIPAAYGSQMTYHDAVTGPLALPPVVEPTYNFDEVPYPVPAGADVAEVRLMYQSVSREYLEELVAASPATLTFPPATPTGFTRALLLEHAWRTVAVDGQTRFPPTEMTRLRIALVDADGDGLPDRWEQAYGLDPVNGDGVNGRNGDLDGDGRSNFREFQDGTAPNAVDGVTHPPVDLVLVLDYSGSMLDSAPEGGGGAKIEVLRDAVEIFLRTWQQYATANGRLGVVYFSDGATVEGGGIVDFAALPPGSTIESRIDTLIAAIRARPAGGSTALGAGIETALQLLLTGGAGHRKQIIVFTNGMQNISPMLRLNGTGQYTIHPEPVSVANGVFGDSGVTATAATPFDTALSSFGVNIHTIGIGVAQTPDDRWLNLILDVATQTSGQHQFISRAFELEGAFLNNLVQSLRGFTPQRLGQYEARLESGAASVSKTFLVDAAATQVTFLLSWSGDDAAPPLDFDLRGPQGEMVTPLGRIIRGPKYVMAQLYFPLQAMNGRPVAHGGTWTMIVRRAQVRGDQQTIGKRGAASFRAYAIADVPRLDFLATFDRSTLKAGQRPVLRVAVLDQAEPIRGVRRVTAVVRRPRVAIGTLLATARVDDRALRNALASGADRPADAAAAKSSLVLGDPSRRDDLVPIEETIELFDDGAPQHGDATAGDGIFSARLHTLLHPGLLVADITAEGSSPRLGTFSRRLRATAKIAHGDWSLAASTLRASILGRGRSGWQIRVHTRPRDVLRNDLGIGMHDRIRFVIPGATPLSPIADNLDGTYSQTFDVPSLDVPVTVSIDRAPAFHRSVTTAAGANYVRWLLLVLLLLLILLVLFLAWRAHRRRLIP